MTIPGVSAAAQADAWMRAQKAHVSGLEADLAAARAQLAAVEALCDASDAHHLPSLRFVATADLRAALAAVPDSAPVVEPTLYQKQPDGTYKAVSLDQHMKGLPFAMPFAPDEITWGRSE